MAGTVPAETATYGLLDSRCDNASCSRVFIDATSGVVDPLDPASAIGPAPITAPGNKLDTTPGSVDATAPLFWGTQEVCLANVLIEGCASGGDITDVFAGPGLTGGATLGSATLGIANGGVTTDMLADGAVVTLTLADASVITAKLADASIVTGKLADASVTSPKIANAAVDATRLKSSVDVDSDRAVTRDHIRDLAVSTAKLADAAVVALKLADGSVLTAKLADASVTAPKLADGSVGTAKVGDAAVTAPKLADGSVGTAKIQNGAVDASRLKSSSTVDADRAVTSDHIRDGAVTAPKAGFNYAGSTSKGGAASDVDCSACVGLPELVDGATITAKLADAAVTTAKLADLAVAGAKIADGAVAASKIADGSVGSAKVADGSITTSKLADVAVVAAKLADGSIVTAKVADGSITSPKIADGAVALADLAFDPATQAELDSHKTSADHDGRYFSKSQLQSPGTVNGPGNPVDWRRLAGVPSGFADGVDADTTYSGGPGLLLSGTTFSVDTGAVQSRVTGSCPAGSWIRVVRADGGVTCDVKAADTDALDGLDSTAFALAGHVHDDRYFTKSDLQSAGSINGASNPVQWSKLVGVPAGLADGVDADSGGTVTNIVTGAGLQGGPINSAGTVDLRLSASGGLSKTQGGGSNELGIASDAVTSAMIRNSDIVDADIASAAGIGWAKIAKAGSSLADLGTRSASDLSSGNVAVARMPAGGGWSLGSDLGITGANVGIGTNSPSARLDVNGNINSAGTVSANLFSGSGSGLTGTAGGLTVGAVTNGVYTTGSYSDPGWLTSLNGGKVTGTVSSASNANTLGGLGRSGFMEKGNNPGVIKLTLQELYGYQGCSDGNGVQLETAPTLNWYSYVRICGWTSPDGPVYAQFVMPSDYNGGDVTVRFAWTAMGTSGNVRWGAHFHSFDEGTVIGNTGDLFFPYATTNHDGTPHRAHLTDVTFPGRAQTGSQDGLVAGKMVIMRAARINSGGDAPPSDMPDWARLQSIQIIYGRS